MRRTAAFVAAWLAAGVAAVSLATAGVSMVGNQVTGDRPAPLSAAEVQDELAAGVTTSTTALSEPGPGSTTTTSTPEATTPHSGPTNGTNGTDGPDTTAATTPTTVASPPTTGPQGPAETRTYTLVGGTATLRFTASGVTVVIASPNAGYSVDVDEAHENGVRVEFRSDEHRSRIEGWWDDGPRDETEEQDEGSSPDLEEGARTP